MHSTPWTVRRMGPPDPFLRWAGGKRQLLDLLVAALPADFDLTRHRYYEPFVGGGALLFALAGVQAHAGGGALGARYRRPRARPIVIGDANSELTNVYAVVRDDVEALIARLAKLARRTSRAEYYRLRDRVPKTDVERAARTIALNRLGFNGLFRTNAAGRFNVPYGAVRRPVVCDADLLRACSQWLAFVEIRHRPFAATLADARAGDVVYLDPPYLPLSPTASFSRYARDDFRELDHYALAGVVRGLCERGVRVILSNSNTAATRRIFGPVLEHLLVVEARRSISAQAATRTPVEEVLGLSHPPSACRDAGRIGQLARAVDVATPTAVAPDTRTPGSTARVRRRGPESTRHVPTAPDRRIGGT